MANNWIKTKKASQFRTFSSPEYVQLEREIRRTVTSLGVGSTATWGSVTGTITDQVDLVTALSLKENVIAAGLTTQYWRGDKTWQTLDKLSVGLDNVNNTSDLDKPISNLTQTALNNKENSILTGTTAQYWRGDKSWQTLDKASVGLSDVLDIEQLPATQLLTITGDITASSTALSTGTIATTLSNTTVTAGSYTLASITVDAKGRITSASSGVGNVASWGSITGTLSSQTDLQNALDAKQNKFSYYETAVDYVALVTNFTINVITKNVNILLYTAIGNAGNVLNIKNSSDGNITITPNGVETIDGETIITIPTPKASLTLQSTGTNWIII